jgi:hypothetical protein
MSKKTYPKISKKISKMKATTKFIKYDTHTYQSLYLNGKLDDKYLEEKEITLHEIDSSMNLSDYGFGNFYLNSITIDHLLDFIKSETFDQSKLDIIMNDISRLASKFIRKYIVMDVIPVVLDAVYRDSFTNTSNKFTKIPLTHMDFDNYMNDINLIEPFMDTWGPQFEKMLGPKGSSREFWFYGKKIVKICNIWISLTDSIEQDPLGIIDRRTVKEFQVIPYIASRQIIEGRKNYFIATGLKYDPDNKWFFKKNMKFGEALIFDSKFTPHASCTLLNNSNKSRKSLECRVMFVRNANISEDVLKDFYESKL